MELVTSTTQLGLMLLQVETHLTHYDCIGKCTQNEILIGTMKCLLLWEPKELHKKLKWVDTAQNGVIAAGTVVPLNLIPQGDDSVSRDGN